MFDLGFNLDLSVAIKQIAQWALIKKKTWPYSCYCKGCAELLVDKLCVEDRGGSDWYYRLEMAQLS